MDDTPPAPRKSYGTTRNRRASVSYGEVERAATALLKAGKRPTIEGIREALKGGSPDTIANALTRYWQDLGTRIEGDPASLSRLPAEVADVAESLWRRALSLAADAAAQRAGADREGLEFFKRENELKAHSLSLKEKELDALLRARERTIQELETHLRTTMGMLQQTRETNQARDTRIAALESQIEAYRRQLAVVVTRAAVRDRGRGIRKQSPAAPIKVKTPVKHRKTTRPGSRAGSKHRAKK
jgi:hypothetical protein